MRFLILIVLILGVSRFAFAQMSDTQVVEAVKEAQAQGKSQNEIILLYLCLVSRELLVRR